MARAPLRVQRRILTQTRARDRLVLEGELAYLDVHAGLIRQAEGVFVEWAEQNARAPTLDAGDIELLRRMRGIFDDPKNLERVFGPIGLRLSGEVDRELLSVVPSAPPGETSKSRRLLEEFTARNALLIGTVGDVILTRLRRALIGASVKTLSELVEEFRGAAKASESRVQLWGRDQVLKLHADLTRTKHESIGVRRYFWTDSNDERVRHRHGELGELSDLGQAFEYQNPPIIDTRDGRRGNPGEDYQCRCTAFPLLE